MTNAAPATIRTCSASICELSFYAGAFAQADGLKKFAEGAAEESRRGLRARRTSPEDDRGGDGGAGRYSLTANGLKRVLVS